MLIKLIAIVGLLQAPDMQYGPIGHELTRLDFASILAISPDASVIAIACGEQQSLASGILSPLTSKVAILEEADERLRVTHEMITGLAEIRSIAFSPNGKYFTASDDKGKIFVWSTTNWAKVKTIETNCGAISPVEFMPDSKSFLACAYQKNAFNSDPHITIWDIQTAAQRAHVRVPLRDDGWVTSLSISPTGKYVATGDTDGNTRVWISDLGQTVARFEHGSWLSCVRFSPSGKYLASADQSGRLKVIAADTWQERHTFEGIKHCVHDMEYVNDDWLVTVGGEWQTPEMSLWSIRDTKLQARFRVGDWELVSSAVWSKGRMLVLSRDGIVYCLSVTRLLELRDQRTNAETVSDEESRQ